MLTQQQIHTEVVKLVSEYGCLPAKKQINPFDRLAEDLNLDSLDMAEIGLDLEEILCPYVDKMPSKRASDVSNAVYNGGAVYVTDVTRIVCDVMGVEYQETLRVVAHSKRAGNVKENERQNPGRE